MYTFNEVLSFKLDEDDLHVLDVCMEKFDLTADEVLEVAFTMASVLFNAKRVDHLN